MTVKHLERSIRLFSIIATGNASDLITRACQLATSLRDTADDLQTIPVDQQLNFEKLPVFQSYTLLTNALRSIVELKTCQQT